MATANDLLDLFYPGNRSLRVVFARNPPDAFSNCPQFPTLQPTLNCPFPGWCVEILKMIADAAEITILEEIYDNQIGSLDWGTLQPNGSWTGVLSKLVSNEADTACLFYQRTDLRDQYFDLSYPITNVQPIYVVKRRSLDIRSLLWNAFKPYSYTTWLVFLASLVVQALAMVTISRVEVTMKRRKEFHPWQMVWNIAELQLEERSNDMRFFTTAGNFLMFVFGLLQAGLFLSLYEGLLLSALLKQGTTTPFKNADEMIALIKKGTYKLTTNYLGNWYFDELKHSNASHFVALRAATANNPVVAVNSVTAALDLVEQGSYVYPIQEDSIAMQMSKLRCNLIYVSEGLPQRSAHLIFQNGSEFLPSINRQIIMQQSFIQRTFGKYFSEGFKLGDLPKCDTSEFEESLATKPLDLSSVLGIFTLGGLGILLSILCFLAEVYVYWHLRLLRLRAKSRLAMGKAVSLLALARVHLVQNTSSFDLIRLYEIKEKQNQFA